MSASASDKFQKVSIATATTLDAPGYTIGDTSITVASTSTWPTDTGITFAIDEVDANGERVAGSYNEYVGTVASGTSVTNVSHVNGTNRNYTAGTTTRVYIPVSEERENRLVEGITQEHVQDGTHSSTLITARTADTTPASGDLILTADVSDSNNLKKATIAQILGNNATSVGGAAQTWAPTITGYSANPSNSSYSYIRVGNLVFCQMTENTNGTSNASTKTYTLPFTAKTRSNASWRGYAQIVNNGSGGQGLILVDSGASTVQFYATNNGGAWTASGSASIVAAAFWYEAA